MGSSGPPVLLWQKLVNRAGTSPAIDEDSDFGTVTHKATQAFQLNRGLKDDGVVGALTWGKV